MLCIFIFFQIGKVKEKNSKKIDISLWNNFRITTNIHSMISARDQDKFIHNMFSKAISTRKTALRAFFLFQVYTYILENDPLQYGQNSPSPSANYKILADAYNFFHNKNKSFVYIMQNYHEKMVEYFEKYSGALIAV